MISQCGKLELIIGNMFSGKTSELVRRINRTRSINKRILVINYIGDNRYSSDSIATHDQTKVKCLKVAKLNDIPIGMLNDYDSFFIDEGQFFTDLYTYALLLVETYHKHVVVSGLDGDADRKMFGDLIKLIPICDSVDKLTAYCTKCNNGRIAPFTKKKNSNDNTDNTDVINNTDVIDIGGSDKYIAVCRYHYFT
jgi:thymidine kinase